jgi:NADPH2:quinone reductase
MKAAIISAFGETPQYSEFPDPLPAAGETLVDVQATVLENFDKVTAAGTHYSSHQLFPQFPAIVGTDGVGRTAEGKLVSFGKMRPPFGAFAEKAAAGYTLPVPEGIDAVKAAAIPPSVLTSLLPLKYSASLMPGETVLINGATGVSGRIAIQVAKLLGAGHVIATGRNPRSLALLPSLGADVVIDLTMPDVEVVKAFATADAAHPVDVVVDFLWGRPAELFIGSFIPTEVGFAKRRIRWLQMGEKAGSAIALPGAALRTSGLQLMGMCRLSFQTLQEEMKTVWDWIGSERVYMEIERVRLADIAAAWMRTDLDGKRLVLVP